MAGAEQPQVVGAAALHEAQIAGVIDDAGEIRVLVIDAHRHHVAAVREFRRRARLLILFAAKQAELRRIARRLRQAEMLECMPGQQPAARRALDEALSG